MSFKCQEILQKNHYDKLADDYKRHYMDAWSIRYRERFIDQVLCEGLDLTQHSVLDAMCGPGQFTHYLLRRWPNACVTGLDISPETLVHYTQSHPSTSVVARSFLDNGFQDCSFDNIFIIGGLHHLQPHIDIAIKEVARLLRPGGVFAFCEPHTAGCLEPLRKLWYGQDSMFEKNESAIDLEGLKKRFDSKFEFMKEWYGGNIAYFPIYNSLVLRVPLWLKGIIAPPLLALEGVIQPIQGKWLSVYVVCQWRKRILESADRDPIICVD